MGLDGKVAIVTGGSLGIGAGIARRLSKDGAQVVITARRPEPLEKTAESIRAAGGEVLAVPGDVGVKADVVYNWVQQGHLPARRGQAGRLWIDFTPRRRAHMPAADGQLIQAPHRHQSPS